MVIVILTVLSGELCLADDVVGLQCERLASPLAIDTTKPRLSWVIASNRRSVQQTAYQVLVASSAEGLKQDIGDLWDSGEVQSDQSLDVEYGGKPLTSRQVCHWKVRVWTSPELQPSSWSKSETWTMGLLARQDWRGAQWISASRWYMPTAHRPPGLIAVGAPAWAQVDLGNAVRIDSVKLYPNQASTFPLRFRIESDDDMDFNSPQVIADCSEADFAIGDKKVVEFPGRGIVAKRVRILILKPSQGGKQSDQGGTESVIRQLEVWSDGRNVALMRPTLQSGLNWDSGSPLFMVDGMPSANDGDTCPDDACPTPTAPLLRKVFEVDRPVKRAMLSYAAHGMARVALNGGAVDDTVLGPRFSDYSKRIYYRTVDVTQLLRRGENVVGATLGNGFFSPPNRGFGQRHNGQGQPRLLLQLEVELADGTQRIIVSDASWRWDRSEVTANDLWGGYREDRRLAQAGWDRPGFNDGAWRQVGIIESMGGKLCASQEPFGRIFDQLKPDRVETNTAYFNHLSAGWPRLEIKNGKSGQTIKLAGDHGVACEYILATNGPATLEPQFIWGSGPTRLTVTGLDEPLTPENIYIQRVGADFRAAGSFHCSNPWLNKLHEVVWRTYRNYCLDYPQDPMREKQGWTQDAQSFFNTAAYLADVDGFYRQWWRDMADNQQSNGLVGSVLPLMGQVVNDWNCPWWSGMIVWLPWEHYIYYGDRGILEEAYEPMRRYVDYLEKVASLGIGTRPIDYPDSHFFLDAEAAKERLLIWSGASDWQNPYTGGQHRYVDTGAGPLVNMTGWYNFAMIVSKSAAILGKKADSQKYATLAKAIAQRTNDKFLDSATGRYGAQSDNQTAQVMPLGVGMVPPEIQERTLMRLQDAIHARKDHVGAGFVGMPYLLQVLTDSGQSELANRIVNQQDFPSWKTLMHHGVIGEGWEGGGAQMPSCGGAVGRWLYQSVLGIRPDPAGPGFKRFIVAPQPDPATSLTSAEGWYDTAYGRIESSWKCSDGGFSLRVMIPPNTSAAVHVPAAAETAVTESGQPAISAPGVTFLRMEQGAAVFKVESGNYTFQYGNP